MINSKPCLQWLIRSCGRSNNQWNVWLKEPNTNADGVPDFPQGTLASSSTTANLKSKRRKAPTAVNRANNLEKHLRSFEKAPRHPSKWQLGQTTLDGPTSLENGPSTPKKLMVEEVQAGGAPAEHVELWKALEIVESALKYTALTFRKVFNSNNKRDILQQLNKVIHSMRPVIEGQTEANAEAVKWYLPLNMNFCKSANGGVKRDPAVTFHSEVLKSMDTNKLDYQF